ncbi:NAD(P)-binding protein [Cucurbitaria berberidis CBS 394.84]|uniref:NAD(P)-binding protein n=1 Tax=Cucurbitaria berberidis CBS 394.84 TaxID=1168544 RepID=A0A9P4GRK9_9PLEO|nr:NAD(P)-binding protein [Cucurbitaria berberidis CBS 394.84]KAF1850047.1 NAD(P)-binding protein [Cucurbitaria berberidis CBS 394.84]
MTATAVNSDLPANQDGRPQILRVGIIGAGEVAQCVHLPTLALLSHLYTVTAICDISQESVAHCSTKFNVPRTYSQSEDLCADPNVDVVFVLTSDEFHATQAITALQHDKHVLIEKPISLSLPSAQRILEAEKQSKGKVFVAYMRRYAAALQAFRDEIPSPDEIKFVRVRDIIGPNAHFVQQSGTFPQQFRDFPSDALAKRTEAAEALIKEVYPQHKEITPEMTVFCRFLGGLGSHDLSVMREVLGMPKACTGVSMHSLFFTATFEYESFAVSYESGLDGVPRFDAHVQVYGANKTVKLQYDTPYVKGLPITVTVDESTPSGGYQQRTVLPTYEDAYTAELTELYACLVKGKAIKTTVADALQDLEIFRMVLQRAFPLT